MPVESQLGALLVMLFDKEDGGISQTFLGLFASYSLAIYFIRSRVSLLIMSLLVPRLRGICLDGYGEMSLL